MRVTHAFIILFFMAGCASLGGQLTELRAKKPSGDSFSQFLASEYLAYAESIFEEGHPLRADYFARKGLAALKNEDVELEERPALVESRQELLAVLTPDIKEVAPAKAAHAQLLFDCWAEKKRLCEEGFPAALADLQFIADVLVHGEGNRFRVEFAKNSAVLSNEASTILDIIGKRVSGYGEYQVQLKPAVKTGSVTAKRLLALEKGLITRGVNAGRIETVRDHKDHEVVLSIDKGRQGKNTIAITIQTYGQPSKGAAP